MRSVLFIMSLVILSMSCADVEHVQYVMTGHTYGFWGGLWHGIIAFFSFIASLFIEDIAIYAVNNNGGWYDFGFCLGIGVFAGSSSKAV